MVYCTKCGTKNEDTALVCIKCGASLETETYTSRRYERRRVKGECFGLPHGCTIVGLAIGVILLLWGFWDLMHILNPTMFPRADIWPLILIVFGILLVLGALYRLSSRPPP
jgi:uncharacterized membrane protein YvbJ